MKVLSAPLAVGRLTRSRFREKEPLQEKKTEVKKKSKKGKGKKSSKSKK